MCHSTVTHISASATLYRSHARGPPFVNVHGKKLKKDESLRAIVSEAFADIASSSMARLSALAASAAGMIRSHLLTYLETGWNP